jgi:photosystem II stability/assembly factor-like uncharacterized protein
VKKILSFLIPFIIISQTQAQWQKQVSNTEANFRSVCAVSDKIVWVGGSKGTFVKTIDGGKTWVATQVQGAAKIYRTEDGGKTWKIVCQTTQKGIFFDGIDFWDAQNGIVFSDPIDGKFVILKTKDGGKTWNPINPENIPENQKGEAAFAASGTSLITFGKNQAYICTGGGESARVFYSENQGENWSVINTNMPASQAAGLFGLRFWDKQHGIAVGGDYQEINKAIPNVLLTSDGGKTWQDALQTNPTGLKESVSVYKKKCLIAVGPSGTCYSKDFGKSWTMIDKSAFHAISISGNGVWAVGGKGVICKLSVKFLK